MKIAFDLDSTLIPNGDEFETEKHLKTLFSILFGGEKLRKGTREIFDFCKKQNWETWIYTTSFRSPLYIKKIFWLNDIKLNGIINQKKHSEVVTVNSSKFPPHFGIDWLIDDSKGVEMEGLKFGFNVIQINSDDDNWVDIIKEKLTEIN
jgi:hypothetical protein